MPFGLFNKLCCHVVGALNAKLISSLFHRQGTGVCLIWNLSVLLYSQRTGVFKAGKIGSVPVLGMHQSFIMTFFVMPNCDITRPKCLHSHGHQLLFELCTLFHGFHSVSPICRSAGFIWRFVMGISGSPGAGIYSTHETITTTASRKPQQGFCWSSPVEGIVTDFVLSMHSFQ